MAERNRYGFSAGDNFEEALAKVQRALQDPQFVEDLNQNFIIADFMDGSKPYPRSDISTMKKIEAEVIAQNEGLDENSWEPEIVRGLSDATGGFKKEGTYKISGKMAMTIVDNIAYTAMENYLIPHQITRFLDITIGGVLTRGPRLSWEKYQTDLAVSGQGLMEDTYSILIRFRPTPKKVK